MSNVGTDSGQRITAQRGHNLPQFRSRFIGREAELARAEDLLKQSPLLMLAGARAVGKTRLALKIASDQLDRFPDGVCYVDLAPLTDPVFIAPSILWLLGGTPEASLPNDESLINHLRERRALLVLDNCEHHSKEVTQLLKRLLRECGQLRILATSREPLGLQSETVHRVSSLSVDDGALLFTSRATATAPSFSPTPDDVETIKAICKQLHGLPLSIELASARIKVLSVQELRRRLDDHIRLTGSSRASLEQATLRALIEWSYQLLDQNEQVLLRRAAVFAGAFSLDVAGAVCAFAPIERAEVPDLLGRLIDKSLVRHAGVEGRYELLEPTKAFGLERLAEAGEFVALQRRRAEHFRTLAEDAYATWGTSRFDELCAEISREYGEFRAVLQWSLADSVDVELGAALAGALYRFWRQTGQAREGQFWLECALEHEDRISAPTLARVLIASATQYFAQGDYERMTALAERAETAYAALGDLNGQARSWHLLAIAASLAGRLSDSYELHARALGAYRTVGDRTGEAVQLNSLAEALTEWEGEHARAEELYAQAAAIAREVGTSYFLALGLSDWSQTAAYRNEFDRADALAREALVILRRLGHGMRIAEALIRIGLYRAWAADWEPARAALREALEYFTENSNPREMARCAEASAALALGLGQPAQAVALLAFSDEWRTLRNLPRPSPMQARFEATIAGAGKEFGRDAFAIAWKEGRTLTPQAALSIVKSIVE